MAHIEQMKFVETVKGEFPNYFLNQRVAEIGSLDINGSIRTFFESCDYTGFDVAAGAGVDRVTQGQLISELTGHYDVTISCECFEHNPYWVETFANMLRLTREGGLIIMTCATHGRPEHGTRRSDEYSAPLGAQVGWQDYYKNLSSDDFIKTFNLKGWFDCFHFFINTKTLDLCFYGIRKGGVVSYGNMFNIMQRSIDYGARHIYGWLQATGDVVMMNGDGSTVLWTDFNGK
jgi:SAM-dependent methyltransferase